MPIDITDVTRRVQYAGSGTGPYNFTFQILDDDDIAVYQDDTLLVKTTNYTVTINADGTGSITTTASIPGTDNITIIGARPYARLTDFSTGGDFFADSVNDELDGILILIQQLREASSRALAMSSTTTFTGSLVFPPPGAGEYLRWNVGGTALETVSASPDDGTFTQSGTGAVARSWTSKVGEVVSVKDFGAIGDGSTNDAAAIQAAIDSIDTSGGKGGVVTLPAGVFNVGTTTINLRANVRLVGAGRRASLITYTGSSAAIKCDSKSNSGFGGARIGLGSSGTAIGLEIATATNSVLYNNFFDIEIASSNVAGQIGIKAVASGGQIVSENWFEDIFIFGLATPIVKTDLEGNTWKGIVISTFGTGASPTGVNDTGCHAEYMEVRIAGVGAGVTTPIAYNTTCDYSTIVLSADIGATGQAISSLGARNKWIVSRAINDTPIGTYQPGETVIDSHILSVGGLLDISGSGAGQIKFPATQVASSNANTLDDYEEGTWTPADGSGAALSFSNVVGRYTKVGKIVTAHFSVTYPSTASGSTAIISGLPFTAGGSGAQGAVSLSITTHATPFTGLVNASATTFQFYTYGAASVTNADLSTDIVRGVVVYEAAD